MALALPLFAITLFVSAFLLFLVQPMVGKMILPKLGGTPQVWNTCMLFFQTALLLGYGYTHTVSTRLPLRRQLLLHGVVLFLPFLFLIPFGGPFNVVEWTPPAGSNPIGATLLLLAWIVGIPFFVVSTTAPLLQRWFAHTGHPSGRDPYFLYGASNLGSLLSLVAYPFLVEPMIPLRSQAWVWTASYVILGALVVACVALVWKSLPRFELAPAGVPTGESVVPTAPDPLPQTPAEAPVTSVKAGTAPGAPLKTGITAKKKGLKGGKPGLAGPAVPTPRIDLWEPRTDPVTGWRRLRWVLLAFAPSSLMLGVTSYVSVDLSPFPLLWVIPLALYLLSFILVFSKWPEPWVGRPHNVMLFIEPIFIAGLCIILLTGRFDPFKATFISFLGFFMVTMVCHGELARDRPTPQFLTEFFLWMSVGGALGGLFNAMLAPIVFTGVAEYPIAIIVASFLRPRQAGNGWFDDLLLSAFPGLGAWSKEKGDNLLKSTSRPERNDTWLLHVFLDILLAAFVLGLAMWLKNIGLNNGWMYREDSGQNGMVKILRFLGFSQQGAMEYASIGAAIGMYGIPLIFCFFYAHRPLRFGLAIAAVIIANQLVTGPRDRTLYAGRSYFGVLRVLQDVEAIGVGGRFQDPEIEMWPGLKPDERGRFVATYTYLMHGTTYHGRNYYDPPALRRLATTYYHRKGPVGVIMERFNWFPGPQNSYWGDARLPASMMGLFPATGMSNLPLEAICDVWSEPPFATIGLGSGTMASYGRCFQHVTYYEIDDKIRGFSLPLEGGDPYFKYVLDAVHRGSNMELIMGDARLSMAKENPKVSTLFTPAGGAKGFNEHQTPLDSPMFSNREKYYKAMVVDAFSSDAIPVHLITEEAILLYMSKIAEDGVLMMHTSNRHLNLVEPLLDICAKHNLALKVGNDVGGRGGESPFLGHFGSEYVMIARKKDYFRDENVAKALQINMPGAVIRWAAPNLETRAREIRDGERRVWTDDFSNIVSILR